MRYKDKKNPAGLKTNPAGFFCLYTSYIQYIIIVLAIYINFLSAN